MTTITLQRFALLAFIATLGCATRGGDGGGAENLPNRGIVPYEVVTDEPEEEGQEGDTLLFAEPTEEREDIAEPSAVFHPDGHLDVYYELRGEDDTPSQIAVIRSEDNGVTFSEPEIVLNGDAEPWFMGHVRAPSVIWQGTTCHLMFEIGDAAGIGYASSEDGRAFAWESAPSLTPIQSYEAAGIGSPSLAVVDRGFELFYRAQAEPDAPFTIARAAALADRDWIRQGVVLRPGEACLDLLGEEEDCWDKDGVSTPEMRLAVNGAGQRVYRMMYTGISGRSVSIGFAASWDGQEWSRYDFNPMMPKSTRDPSNIIAGDRYLLFFVQDKSRAQGIALAINNAGKISDIF